MGVDSPVVEGAGLVERIRQRRRSRGLQVAGDVDLKNNNNNQEIFGGHPSSRGVIVATGAGGAGVQSEGRRSHRASLVVLELECLHLKLQPVVPRAWKEAGAGAGQLTVKQAPERTARRRVKRAVVRSNQILCGCNATYYYYYY